MQDLKPRELSRPSSLSKNTTKIQQFGGPECTVAAPSLRADCAVRDYHEYVDWLIALGVTLKSAGFRDGGIS